MSKKYIILVFLCLFSGSLRVYSQTNLASISGLLFDEGNKSPIELANVVVLNEDSIFICGTVTDYNGSFSIENIPVGKQILRLSYIGYRDLFINVEVNFQDITLGELFMMNNSLQLGEVLVTSSVPQYKLKGGSFIANVNNSRLSSIGSANELLNHIPGIANNENQDLQVFGRGTPIVYINNRKLYDLNELNQLQSSEILTVELIKNPGARYDAENKAVIIIKTKSDSSGFSLNALSRTRIGKYVGNREGVDLKYSNNKFNAFVSYFHSYSKSKTEEKSSYDIYADTLWNQTLDMPYVYQENMHDLSTSFDFSPSSNHTVGAQYKGSYSSSKNNIKGLELFSANHTQFDVIESQTLQKQKPKTNLINGFYTGKLGDKIEMQLIVDYVERQTTSNQYTDEKAVDFSNNKNVHIISNSDFKLFAGKLIQTYNLNSNNQIEFGAEYNIVRGKGSYLNSDNSGSNNVYTNDEEKIAGFISYMTTINKYGIGIGLRYEHLHEKSTEDSTKQVRLDNYSSNVYPNILLSRDFREISMSLNANRRTRRPSFSELNNNDLYINRFLTQKGNPFLKREDYYNINYNIKYKILNLSVGYSYIKNPINIEFKEYGNSSANAILSFKNYDKYQNLNMMTAIDYTISFWKPQLTLSLVQPFFSAKYRDEKKTYNDMSYSVNFDNDFILPKDYLITLFLEHKNDYYSYMTRWGGYTQVDIRVRKSFFKKTLNLNMYVNDIFNIKKEKSSSYVDKYNLTVYRQRENRYITFSLQYQFNNTNKRYRGQPVSSDEINRL